MRKRSYKGRCTKKSVSKSKEVEDVFNKLFPYVEYDPYLSYEEAKRKNTEIERQMNEESGSWYFCDGHSDSIGNTQPDDSDPQVVMDNQLEAFYKEHYKRRN